MADLNPWQRKIKNPEEAKEGERVAYYEGPGLIASDMNNEEYKKQKAKNDAERKKWKKIPKTEDIIKVAKSGKNKGKEKTIKSLATRLAEAKERGKQEGAKEYRKSDNYKAKIAAAEKRGAKEARPRANLKERAEKKTAKAKKLLAEAKKIENKVSEKKEPETTE